LQSGQEMASTIVERWWGGVLSKKKLQGGAKKKKGSSKGGNYNTKKGWESLIGREMWGVFCKSLTGGGRINKEGRINEVESRVGGVKTFKVWEVSRFGGP